MPATNFTVPLDQQTKDLLAEVAEALQEERTAVARGAMALGLRLAKEGQTLPDTGVRRGRKPISSEAKAEIRELAKVGEMSGEQIAAQVGVSLSTVRRYSS